MDSTALSALLLQLIRQQPDADQAISYLSQQAETYHNQPTKALFYRVFTALPRFVGKQPVTVTPEVAGQLTQLRPGFTVSGWPLDRVARVWWLLQLSADDRATYVSTIENLFKAAEMNELAALYSALPVLAYPDAWRFQATEGIRNNIGPVQEAIMLHNPYPAEELDEAAWNQLIMKAFFTDKPVEEIIGFDERANERLALIVIDYARERRAAGRSIHPQLWRLAEPFAQPEERAQLEALFHNSSASDV